MPETLPLSTRIAKLREELWAWVERNGLAEDSRFWAPESFYGDKLASVPSKPELVLTFEGDLHSVLWQRPVEDRPAGESERLRAEFDAIVKQHRFRFDFKDETAGHFYAR